MPLAKIKLKRALLISATVAIVSMSFLFSRFLRIHSTYSMQSGIDFSVTKLQISLLLLL
jgi:hypothetical protein